MLGRIQMKESELSLDLRILLKIYEDVVINEKEIKFMNLVEHFKNDFTKKQIANSLEKNNDLCMIDTDWKKFGDKWSHSLTINGSSMEFVRELYKKVEHPLPKNIDAKKVRCICEYATECPHFETGLCRIKIKQEEGKSEVKEK